MYSVRAKLCYAVLFLIAIINTKTYLEKKHLHEKSTTTIVPISW